MELFDDMENLIELEDMEGLQRLITVENLAEIIKGDCEGGTKYELDNEEIIKLLKETEGYSRFLK